LATFIARPVCRAQTGLFFQYYFMRRPNYCYQKIHINVILAQTIGR
jgi:hypothetical protein